MIPIFQAAHKRQIFSVFLIALIGIARQAAEQCNTHKQITQSRHHQHQPGERHEHGQQAKNQARPQKQGIEFVRAISTGHKPCQTRFDLIAQPAQPATTIRHGSTPSNIRCYYYMEI